ncbi:MAG: glutamate 5-kinase [Sneathiella sp.]|uniref:glutamate 5-kinase n=1 Tax=Sneathiella sp. TaxID=1964365 RepID=UPI003001988D
MAALIDRFTKAKRVVIKIGSALLVDSETGQIRRDWLTALSEDISKMRARGQEVLIVSSGSIAMGRHVLGLPNGPLKLEASQAAAAAGQIQLAHAYQEILALQNLQVAQILLTPSDTEERRRYLNARSTVATLLGLGAIPVVNENDTVATSEIRYGDNDRLAARVAQMISADCLVLLSDIDGLYDRDPKANEDATLIPEVTELSDEVMAMAGTSRTDVGSGGMITKLKAAQIAMAAGCTMFIASGTIAHPMSAIEKGANSTCFVAHDTPRKARKKWIAASLTSQGRIFVDGGAEKALNSGKSLLPAGVTKVDGRFDRGDLVTVMNTEGTELGRGLIAYSSEDAARICGHKSGEITEILGYSGRDEMIHRDELALN